MALGNDVILFRLLLATAIGMILGVERERSLKPAGVRTHMLVCLNSCIIAIISAYGFKSLGMPNDPARMIVGVLQGIGFLCAGVIWRNQEGGIMGITTAAEVFLLTSLGIGCGLGHYFLTLTSTLITYVTLKGSRIYSRFRGENDCRQGKTNLGEEPGAAETCREYFSVEAEKATVKQD